MTRELDYLLDGDPREALVWHRRRQVWGDPVFADRCTLAHLTATDDAAVARFGFGVEVLQDAFNTGVTLSAGTHDFGRVLDVFIPRVDWLVAQRFFRARGWAAWYRKPPAFSSHIHMISLPVVDTGVRVGEFVPGQIRDYLATPALDGLAGTNLDPTWHPDPIVRFDYEQWKADNMPTPKDWDDADWAAFAKKGAPVVAEAVWDFIVRADPEQSAQAALKKAANS